MPQRHDENGRASLLVSLVAAGVAIMAIGGLGSLSMASGCPTAGWHHDISAVATCGEGMPSVMASPSSSAWAAASPAAALSVTIEARDPYFSPTEVSVSATHGTRMVLTNDGYATHNLTIDELGIQLVASRGGTDELTLVDPAAGVYVFYCSISGHREAGMEGTLVIE